MAGCLGAAAGPQCGLCQPAWHPGHQRGPPTHMRGAQTLRPCARAPPCRLRCLAPAPTFSETRAACRILCRAQSWHAVCSMLLCGCRQRPAHQVICGGGRAHAGALLAQPTTGTWAAGLRSQTCSWAGPQAPVLLIRAGAGTCPGAHRHMHEHRSARDASVPPKPPPLTIPLHSQCVPSPSVGSCKVPTAANAICPRVAGHPRTA